MQIRRQEVLIHLPFSSLKLINWSFLSCVLFFRVHQSSEVSQCFSTDEFNLSISVFFLFLLVDNRLFNTLNNFLAKPEARRPECIYSDVEPGACQLR